MQFPVALDYWRGIWQSGDTLAALGTGKAISFKLPFELMNT